MDGCVRMCDTCPKRALNAAYMDPEIIAQIRRDVVEGREPQRRRFSEIDPLDVDHAASISVGSLADYGKEDAAMLPFLTFSRRRSTTSSLSFPVSTTLEMISTCTGPEKVKRGLFRSSLQCGAYQEGLRLLEDLTADDPEAFRVYVRFLEEEDRRGRLNRDS